MKRNKKGPDRSLTVATYNIHRCIGIDGLRDPDRVARVIRELDADIVALQEVDSRSGIRSDAAQMDYLADVVGYSAVPGPTICREDGNYGNALLTGYPILESRALDISVEGREPRGAIDVVLQVGNSRLRVVVTHLGLTRAERNQQIRKLLSAFGERRSRNAVLLGDVNEWLPFSSSLRLLDRIFGKSPSPPTFPSRFPFLSLDRIWVRPCEVLTLIHNHRSPLSRAASDHLPLKAIIRA